MKRIQRDRRLTPEEAARYKKVREQIAAELKELIDRHHDRCEANAICTSAQVFKDVSP